MSKVRVLVNTASGFWVKSAYLEPLRLTCLSYGIDVVQLMASHNLPPSLLRLPDQPLSHAVYAQLMTDGARLSGDSLFGMHVGKRFNLANLDATDMMVMPRMSLVDFYPVMQHMFSAQARGTRYQLLNRGNHFYHCLEMLLPGDIDGRQLTLLILSAHLKIFQEMFGQSWQPAELLLRSQPAKDRQALEQYFGCSVVFGASLDALRMPASLLELPPKSEQEVSRQKLVERGVALRRYADVPGLIRCFIESRLSIGRFEQSHLATWLGVHPRVLQKCLKDRGTSYAELLRQCREVQACQLLEQSELPVSDIATQLGYSASEVFVRTFKDWKGVTPLQWRKRSRLTNLAG